MEKKWYSTITNKDSAHEQGLIIEEETGNAIAVSYKPENAKLIAAAPELLKFAEDVLRYLEAGSISKSSDKKFVRMLAREIINKVTEN